MELPKDCLSTSSSVTTDHLAVMNHRKLCSQCEGLTLDDLEHGYLLYTNVAGLADEVKSVNACTLCALIWWSLRYDHLSILRTNKASVRLFLNPPPQHSGGKFHRIDIVVTKRDSSEFGWAPRQPGEPWHLGPPDSFDIFRGHLALYGSFGDSLGGYCHYQATNIDSESTNCFELVQHWLRQCLQDHGSACQTSPTYLPTRLIDVGPPDGSIPPKLAVTTAESFPHHSSAKYIALSYCWGTAPFLCTTSYNIGAFQTSIPWDDIPKTIQDAIVITRRLGIQYLWTDALCIIQGKDYVAISDWQTESTRMCQIYQGAVFTIAAASAAHAHEGLFRKRSIPQMRNCELKQGFKYPGTVHVGADSRSSSSYREPLHTRAWALQEQLVSNRILTYGTFELSWLCRKSFHRESVPESTLQDFRFAQERTHLNELIWARFKKSEYGSQSEWLYREWSAIMEDYSGRNLTYVSDKLPALAGLADMISKSRGYNYLFGMWYGELAHQLLWRNCGKLIGATVEYKRQAQSPLPSWTWVSTDGKIQFLHGFKRLAEIKLWTKLDTHNSNQFGEARRRPLDVFGVIRHLPSIRCEHAATYYGGYDRYLPWTCHAESLRTYIDDVGSLPETNVRDSPDSFKELVNTVFLFVGYKEGVTTQYAGLILVRAGHSRFTFRRIGLFEGWPAKTNKRIIEPERVVRKSGLRRWIRIV